jgi:hypothetical protein
VCPKTETKNLCRDRAERFEHYPGIAPGTGRAFSVHHHGEASTSDMDGWAEQFLCNGETKVAVCDNIHYRGHVNVSHPSELQTRIEPLHASCSAGLCDSKQQVPLILHCPVAT